MARPGRDAVGHADDAGPEGRGEVADDLVAGVVVPAVEAVQLHPSAGVEASGRGRGGLPPLSSTAPHRRGTTQRTQVERQPRRMISSAADSSSSDSTSRRLTCVDLRVMFRSGRAGWMGMGSVSTAVLTVTTVGFGAGDPGRPPTAVGGGPDKRLALSRMAFSS